MSYRLKSSDFETKKETIPETKPVDVSPYGVPKNITDAAAQILANHKVNWKQPSFGLYQASQKEDEPKLEANDPPATLSNIRKVIGQSKEALKKSPNFEHSYHAGAVDKSIDSHNRSGRGGKIGGTERKRIHALLRGWRGK